MSEKIEHEAAEVGVTQRDGGAEGQEQMEARYSALAASFESLIQDADRASGTPRWFAIWKQAQRMHSENETLRVNFMQTQVLLQEHYAQWVKLQTALSEYVGAQKPIDDDYMEKVERAINLNAKMTNTIIRLTDAANRLKKELRATEFQSQFHIHINLFCQFMNGLNAIFFKHLRGTPMQKELLKDVGRLAKVIDVQSQETEKPSE